MQLIIDIADEPVPIAVERIETLHVGGTVPVAVPQMPLTNQMGLVAQLLHSLRQRGHVLGQGTIFAAFDGEALHARAYGVVAGHQGWPGRGAGVLGVKAVQDCAVVGQGVYVGGRDLVWAVETDVVPPLEHIRDGILTNEFSNRWPKFEIYLDFVHKTYLGRKYIMYMRRYIGDLIIKNPLQNICNILLTKKMLKSCCVMSRSVCTHSHCYKPTSSRTVIIIDLLLNLALSTYINYLTKLIKIKNKCTSYETHMFTYITEGKQRFISWFLHAQQTHVPNRRRWSWSRAVFRRIRRENWRRKSPKLNAQTTFRSSQHYTFKYATVLSRVRPICNI